MQSYTYKQVQPVVVFKPVLLQPQRSSTLYNEKKNLEFLDQNQVSTASAYNQIKKPLIVRPWLSLKEVEVPFKA